MGTIIDIIEAILIFGIGLSVTLIWMLSPVILGYHIIQTGSIFGFIIAAVIAVPFYSKGIAMIPFELMNKK